MHHDTKQSTICYFLLVISVFTVFFFLFPRPNKLHESFADNETTGIQSVLANRQDMPLSQYMMMASYDSAYDGTLFHNEQLLSVIKTGCRVFDFQIFMDDKEGYNVKRPFIGYSTDPTFEEIQGVDSNISKRLTFSKALSTLAINCFNPTAPNFKDPVFLHLRIKSVKYDIYDRVAQDIQENIATRLFLDQTGQAVQVSKNTRMKDIMGKIIVVVNRKINPEYTKYTRCPTSLTQNDLKTPCINLSRFVNIESGGSLWRTLAFENKVNAKACSSVEMALPIIDEKTQSMGILLANNSDIELFMILPPLTTNPDIISTSHYVSQNACQTLFFRFYVDDANLRWYMGLFSKYKTAFIPMGYAINAISSPEINTSFLL